jgi:hypothetical protein
MIRGEIKRKKDKTREGKKKKRIRNAVGDRKKEDKGEKRERCAKMGKDEEKSKHREEKGDKGEERLNRGYLGIYTVNKC